MDFPARVTAHTIVDVLLATPHLVQLPLPLKEYLSAYFRGDLVPALLDAGRVSCPEFGALLLEQEEGRKNRDEEAAPAALADIRYQFSVELLRQQGDGSAGAFKARVESVLGSFRAQV